jgi:hypothetical protein
MVAIGTRFLGLHVDDHVNWKKHNDQIFSKLSAASFVIRKVLPVLNPVTLQMVYFASTWLLNMESFWGEIQLMHVKLLNYKRG